MAGTENEGLVPAPHLEEVALRRKLLFRLLRGFDFSHPEFHGEQIADPLPPEVRERLMAARR